MKYLVRHHMTTDQRCLSLRQAFHSLVEMLGLFDPVANAVRVNAATPIALKPSSHQIIDLFSV